MNEHAPKRTAGAPDDGLLGFDIPTHSADGRALSSAARRALAEAAARRAAAQQSAENASAQNTAEGEKPDEKGGPKGPEPTRFGDWERKGIAVDF